MAKAINDVSVPEDLGLREKLLLEKHADYLATYGNTEEGSEHAYEYCVTEYLRMSGVYWGLTCMSLLGQLDRMNRVEVVSFIRKCRCDNGGYSASPGHDSHLLYTLSAIQICCLYDAVAELDVDGIVEYVAALQREDGSFSGDQWGEVDSRFSFCALACVTLLHRQDAIDVRSAADFVVRCMNFDGGFGVVPGSESHSGQVFCCVGALALANQLDSIDADTLGWWLCERQLPSGGLNGRPEKLPDVCYSWWVLSSLAMIKRLHWIDKDKLRRYILACQDDETGGFADRPGNIVDPFHTLFGVASLSLLGDTSVEKVNPVLCMPQSVLDRANVYLL
eukprot:scpid33428/ scgid14516/ Geranylgeranyl transferase type-2 subunit beta; Geranylgeranyl transferase type II subunit beta; Rab geranyl-geranyltransferase subunit beta; Rab geranylgeranyltransferase subunit beta; Type II protein geranyl-geranyltransferase subunit beta